MAAWMWSGARIWTTWAAAAASAAETGLKPYFTARLKVRGTRHFGHHDVHAGIPQIEGLGVALGAEPDDGHLLALENPQIRILIVIHFHG